MKHTTRIIMSVAAVLLLAAFATYAQTKQDKYAAKAPNGIAFSEFRGYESWPLIAPSLPENAGGCGTAKEVCIKTILGNPVLVKAYQDGVPANGHAFPDGAVLAKVEWNKKNNDESPYNVAVPGSQTEVSFMVKDAKRFPETHGWGYATFRRTDAGTFVPFGNNAGFAKTCHQCHTIVKDRDYVYTSYASR